MNDPIPTQEPTTNEWLRKHPKLIAATMGGMATLLTIGGGLYGKEFTYQDKGCVVTPRDDDRTPEQNIIDGLQKMNIAKGYDNGDMNVAVKKFNETSSEPTRLCGSEAPFFDFTGNPFIILSEDQ